MSVLNIYRYISLRNPFQTDITICKCHSHHIEEAFRCSERPVAYVVEVTQGSLYDTSLFLESDIVLRWCLYAFLAGLDLYKMYSVCIV